MAERKAKEKKKDMNPIGAEGDISFSSASATQSEKTERGTNSRLAMKSSSKLLSNMRDPLKRQIASYATFEQHLSSVAQRGEKVGSNINMKILNLISKDEVTAYPDYARTAI